MSYYATDEEIQDRVFDGHEIPSDNTVNEERNTAIKKKIQAYMNRILLSTELKDDTYGIYREKFLDAYELIIDGEALPSFMDNFWNDIRTRGKPAIATYEPYQRSRQVN